MKFILIGSAVGLSAMSAAGQNYILRIEGGPTQIDLSSGAATFSVDVVGDAEPDLGTHMLWGSFGLEISEGSLVQSVEWTSSPWSEFTETSGYQGNGSFGFVEFGQFARTGDTVLDGSQLGQRIGSFEITISSTDLRSGELELDLLMTDSIALSTIDSDTDISYYSTPETLSLEGFSVNITPAPSSFAILGLLGCGCTRRRRSH
jgi:hypothetical protein